MKPIVRLKIQFKSWFEEPVFWVFVLFGAIQLFGITDPPLEIAHSWRQAFTGMVTRNYVENGMDWLHPRIDMAGEKTGIVGAEFPLFNYLSLLPSRVFGYAHWYGRCVNLIVVMMGAYNFYNLLKRFYGANTALFATVILLSSSWFTFSRKVMPDTFSVSLVLIGMRYGVDYWLDGGWKAWLKGVVAISLGVLSKIPSMSLLAIAVLVFWKNPTQKNKLIWTLLGLVLAVIPAFFWYFYWVPKLNDTFGYHLFFPKGLFEGWMEIKPLWRLLLEKFYFTSFYSFLALVLAFVGLWVVFRNPMSKSAIASGAVVVVFFLFILKTGAVFPQHTYYSLPFLPVMALWAGLGLNQLSDWIKQKNIAVEKPQKWSNICVLLVVIEALSNQIHDHIIKPSEHYKLTLETEIAAVIPKNEKVVFISSANPQELFLLHRKGWTVFPSECATPNSIEQFRQLGAKYVVVNLPVLTTNQHGPSIKEALHHRRLLYRNQHYAVYIL
jgi:4-amino-4-deoxy-L-arabinose transferase-like glycosyltransferase